MLNCFIAERLLWITLRKKAQWLRKAVVDNTKKAQWLRKALWKTFAKKAKWLRKIINNN